MFFVIYIISMLYLAIIYFERKNDLIKDSYGYKKTKYSVLMAVYYKEKTEWLDYSINSMLNQTIKPDEFVLVEDGPLTDGLNQIIDKHVKQNKKCLRK